MKEESIQISFSTVRRCLTAVGRKSIRSVAAQLKQKQWKKNGIIQQKMKPLSKRKVENSRFQQLKRLFMQGQGNPHMRISSEAKIRDSYINQFKQSQKMFGDALFTTVSEVISQSKEWCAQNDALKFFELQLFQNCFPGGSYRKLLASCHTHIKDGENVADQGFFKPFLGVKMTP